MNIQEIARSLREDFDVEAQELDEMSDLAIRNLHADLTQAVLISDEVLAY